MFGIGRSSAAAAHALELAQAIDKSQAVIEFDLNGVILFANENFLRVLGYTLADIQGKHHRMFVAPSHAASSDYREFWTRLKAGHYQAGQYKRIAKDGSDVWIQASYNPVLDRHGKPFKVTKFAVDITAEK